MIDKVLRSFCWFLDSSDWTCLSKRGYQRTNPMVWGGAIRNSHKWKATWWRIRSSNELNETCNSKLKMRRSAIEQAPAKNMWVCNTFPEMHHYSWSKNSSGSFLVAGTPTEGWLPRRLRWNEARFDRGRERKLMEFASYANQFKRFQKRTAKNMDAILTNQRHPQLVHNCQ